MRRNRNNSFVFILGNGWGVGEWIKLTLDFGFSPKMKCFWAIQID